MRGRFRALVFGLAAALTGAGSAEGHRLDAAYRVLPGRMVRIETWFDNGQIPKTGQVEVFGDGELVVKGRLSSQGLFLFDAPPDAALVRVVIDAGEGHGKELTIAAEQFAADQTPEQRATTAEMPTSQPHESGVPIKDVLIGIALVLAVAAFVLSLRNQRSIREMRRSS
jgi:hypothetical protein